MSDKIEDFVIGEKPTALHKTKTYVMMVLDKSGSMQTGLQETINGFNEQVQAVAMEEDENTVTAVSLVTFNQTVSVDILNESPSEMEELTVQRYQPYGMTALYDGVGTAIDVLMQQPDINDENTSVLMVILSDGEENSSKSFRAEQIASQIKELTATGRWTFTYMGAGVDLSEISERLNISAGNIMAFDASNAEGYAMAKNAFVAGTSMYMSTRKYSVDMVSSVGDFYDNAAVKNNDNA